MSRETLLLCFHSCGLRHWGLQTVFNYFIKCIKDKWFAAEAMHKLKSFLKTGKSLPPVKTHIEVCLPLPQRECYPCEVIVAYPNAAFQIACPGQDIPCSKPVVKIVKEIFLHNLCYGARLA